MWAKSVDESEMEILSTCQKPRTTTGWLVTSSDFGRQAAKAGLALLHPHDMIIWLNPNIRTIQLDPNTGLLGFELVRESQWCYKPWAPPLLFMNTVLRLVSDGTALPSSIPNREFGLFLQVLLLLALRWCHKVRCDRLTAGWESGDLSFRLLCALPNHLTIANHWQCEVSDDRESSLNDHSQLRQVSQLKIRWMRECFDLKV